MNKWSIHTASPRPTISCVGSSRVSSRPWRRSTSSSPRSSSFLFYEEIDWATRAPGRYAMLFSPESKIYHKKGMATGSGQVAADRGPTAEYYLHRSRLLFTKKYYFIAIPTVVLVLLVTIMYKFMQGKVNHAKILFDVLMNRRGGRR